MTLFDSFDLNDPAALRNRAILETMYACGLRVSEVCSLTLAELDLNERILTVTGKGDKQRIVPFYKRLRTLLTRYLRDSRALYLKEEHGFVFVSQRGAPITPRAVQLILAQAGQDAGLNQPLHPPFCGIRLRRICWTTASTCAQSRNCWVTARCQRHRFTRM